MVACISYILISLILYSTLSQVHSCVHGHKRFFIFYLGTAALPDEVLTTDGGTQSAVSYYRCRPIERR